MGDWKLILTSVKRIWDPLWNAKQNKTKQKLDGNVKNHWHRTVLQLHLWNEYLWHSEVLRPATALSYRVVTLLL